MSDYLTLRELAAELGNLPRYVRQVRPVAGGDRVAWQGSEDQVTWFTLGEAREYCDKDGDEEER